MHKIMEALLIILEAPQKFLEALEIKKRPYYLMSTLPTKELRQPAVVTAQLPHHQESIDHHRTMREQVGHKLSRGGILPLDKK